MAFFNKEEEVLDIQLTPYGKRLLAEGKFKPAKYAFFDKGVLYDSTAGGFVEIQNNAQDRILDDTPSLKTQAVYSGRELAVTEIHEEIDDAVYDVQQTADRHYALSMALGTSAQTSNYAPSWRVKALQGELNGFAQYETGSLPTQKIPQLQIDSQYETFLYGYPPSYAAGPRDFIKISDSHAADEASPPSCTDELSLINPNTGQQIIRVSGSALVLQIEEDNTPFYNENFDMEIFEVETVTVANIDTPGLPAAERHQVEKLKPLFFIRSPELIKDGILLDKSEVEKIPPAQIDVTCVDYFLKVSVDDEISEDTLCKLRSKLRDRNQYYVNDELHCKEGGTVLSRDVYDGDPTEPSGGDC